MTLFNVMIFIGEAMVTLSNSCDIVTDFHWDIFIRANLYSNYIRYSEIFSKKISNRSEYMESVLQKSYQHFRKPVIFERIESSWEDPFYDFYELFSWSGEQLPLRNSQKNSTMLIHDDKRLQSLHKDDSHFSTFVTSANIGILDKYLRGPPRKPFDKTRGRYLIAVQENYSESFDSIASSILKRLWIDYGIARALVVSTCQDEYYYQYDPFAYPSDVEQLPQDKLSVRRWGKVQKSYRNVGNSMERWTINYPFYFNKYPMASAMFRRLPTALYWDELPHAFVNSYFCDAQSHSKDYGGVDGIIVGNLFKILNLTPHVFNASNEYGFQLDNKSYTGSIGDVLYSRAGFSSNGRFIQDYGTSEIEFMYPVFFDKFCIIAPKAKQIPQWLAVFRCFQPHVWCLFIVSTTTLGLIWFFLKKWTQYLRRNNLLTRPSHEIVSAEHEKITVAVINMWLIMTSGIPSLLPYYGVERLFMTGCLLLSLTIGGTFQGSLTTSYSTKSYYKDIHTLSELDESGYKIGSSSRNLANIFESEGNPVFESLRHKFEIRKVSTINQTAFWRNICCIERASDIKVIITTTYELADGSALLHVVEECPRSYHLSFVVRKGWPFLNRFNDLIMRLSEAGLLYEWYQQVEAAIILSTRIKRLKDLENTLQAFTLEDMQTAFYLISLGMLACTIVFIGEVYQGRKMKMLRLNSNAMTRENVNGLSSWKFYYRK